MTGRLIPWVLIFNYYCSGVVELFFWGWCPHPPKPKSIIIPKTPYEVISQCLFNSRLTLSNPPLLKPLKMQKKLKIVKGGT
jgi:hypothetical protein